MLLAIITASSINSIHNSLPSFKSNPYYAFNFDSNFSDGNYFIPKACFPYFIFAVLNYTAIATGSGICCHDYFVVVHKFVCLLWCLTSNRLMGC